MPILRRLLVLGALVALAGPLAAQAVAADGSATGTPAAALAADGDAGGGDSTTAAELGPTTEAPWVPPTPIATERGWERAVRFPLRVATFPLSLLGEATRKTLIHVEETSLVPRIEVLAASLPRTGFIIRPASLGDRTGFGLMVRYRPPQLGKVLLLEASGSTHKYTRTRVALARGPAAIDYLYGWMPRERFFGTGLVSGERLVSTYAYREQHIDLGLRYPWERLGEPPPRTQLEVHAGPREMILHRGREEPSFDDAFPAFAFQVDQRQEHFVFGAALVADRRTGRPHWTKGWRVKASADRFNEAIETFTLRDAHTDAPHFTRMSVEGETGWSFYRDPRTVRLSVRAVNQRVDGGTGPLLLPDLMSLGGHAGLAGFEPGRFHDVDLVVSKLTYIFPMLRNLEMELHAETGGVFGEIENARLDRFRNSYGFGFRVRTDVAPLAYVGIDRSSESTRLRFMFGGIE